MARCLNYFDDRKWREVSAPDIVIARVGFDTATLHFHRPIRVRDESVTSFPIGSRGDGEFRNMWITSSQVTETPGKMFRANVTYTGIYQDQDIGGTGYWLNQQRVESKQLFKPVQTSMRCYSDKITERSLAGSNYILTIPRLTIVEDYVTSDSPNNSDIGKEGVPLQPPTEITLPPLPNALAFDKIPVQPNGWVLNTRSWNQVFDNPLYHVVDEWEYQLPEEYVNIEPA